MTSLIGSSSDSGSDADTPDELGTLADEFLQAVRNGGQPNIQGYCKRYPHLAERMLSLFPTLLALEQIGETQSPEGDGATEATSYATPTRIGDFQILREIGRGGMGIVYEAVQQSLGRRVALKVLPASASLTPTNIQRFRRESRAAAKLHHSNIVPVFGVGEHEGINYYVMQFIQGVGLDQVLAQLPENRQSSILNTSPVSDKDPEAATADDTPAVGTTFNGSDSSGGLESSGTSSDRTYWRRVAMIGMQLARALEFAHSQGVLHRDLKPANVLLDVQGTVWLTDFGLAQVSDDVDLTRTGDIVGTLRYLAPERLRGECSPQSDVYGLGMTLYELLTFVPAFGETDRHALVKQIVQQSPRAPRSINHKIPRDLETIILKAIEKEIPNRYARAADLAEDLLRFLNDRPILARRVAIVEQGWRWCRRNPTAAILGSAVAVLLLGLAFAGVTLRLVSSDRQRAQQAERAARSAQQTANREQELALAQSHLAAARGHRYSREPARKMRTLEEIKQAISANPPAELRFALRNEAIAALAQTDVHLGSLWNVGFVPREVGAFDRELTRYARVETDSTVSVLNLNSGETLVKLAISPELRQWIKLSSDGHYLVCQSDFLGGTFEVWDVDAQRRVLGAIDFLACDFSMDSQRLVVSRENGECLIYRLSDGEIVKQLSLHGRAKILAFAPDDKRLAYVLENQPHDFKVLDIESGRTQLDVSRSQELFALAWHPNGTQLAVAVDAPARIEVFDLTSVGRVNELNGHEQRVEHLAFDGSGRYLSSYAWDGTLRVWDLTNGSQIASLTEGGFVHRGHSSIVAIRALPNALQAITVDTARPFSTLSKGNMSLPYHSSSEVLLGNGRILACASGNGLEIWDLWLNDFLGGVPTGPAFQVFVNAASDELVVSTANGLKKVKFQIDEEQCRFSEVEVLQEGMDNIQRSDRTPDGSLWSLAGTNKAYIVHADATPVWDVPKAELKEHAVLSHNGEYCVTYGWLDLFPRMWSLKTKQLHRRMTLTERAYFTFTPDSKNLVISNSAAYVFRDIDSWKVTRRLDRTGCAFPGPIAFSPTGEYVAVELSWGAIHILRGDTFETIAKLERTTKERYVHFQFLDSGNQLVAIPLSPTEVNVWKLDELSKALDKLDLSWTDSKQQNVSPIPIEPTQPKPLKFAYGQLEPSIYLRQVLEDADNRLASKPTDINYANAVAWLNLTLPPEDRRAQHAADIMEPFLKERGDLGPELNNTLAIAYYRLDRFEESLRLLDKHPSHDSNDLFLSDTYTRAMCQWKLGKEDEARSSLDAAECLFRAATPIIPESLKEIEQLRREAKTLITY